MNEQFRLFQLYVKPKTFFQNLEKINQVKKPFFNIMALNLMIFFLWLIRFLLTIKYPYLSTTNFKIYKLITNTSFNFYLLFILVSVMFFLLTLVGVLVISTILAFLIKSIFFKKTNINFLDWWNMVIYVLYYLIILELVYLIVGLLSFDYRLVYFITITHIYGIFLLYNGVTAFLNKT